MANPLTFSPVVAEPAPRPAALPDLPLPANAQPRASEAFAAFQAAMPRSVQGIQQFRLDQDLSLALKDMHEASGEPWGQWLERAVNESLRQWLGR